MLHLCTSNRPEALLAQLAAQLRVLREGAGALTPAMLVTRGGAVRDWLLHGLAEQCGIAANLTLCGVEGLISRYARAAWDRELLGAERMRDRLLSLLLDEKVLSSPELASARGWLYAAGEEPATVDRRRFELACELARLFDDYTFSRPAMLARWPKGLLLTGTPFAQMERWQRHLWLLATGYFEKGPHGALTLIELLELGAPSAPLIDENGEESPLFLFDVPCASAPLRHLLHLLSERCDLYLYARNPCSVFWDERPERSNGAEAAGTARALPSLLALWGKPGRENLRALGELPTHKAVEHFVDPLGGEDLSLADESSLLKRLQSDLLKGAPDENAKERAEAGIFAEDRSLQLLACASARREAEELAGEIWALLRDGLGDEGAPLRLHEIAIAFASPAHELPSRLAHLSAAFSELHALPMALLHEGEGGAPPTPLSQALRLLLDLPLGKLSRPELLALLTHPALSPHLQELSSDEFEQVIDALGIFRGADRAGSERSYAEGDLFNWDQGLRRLALASVMLPSEEAELFELEGERYLIPLLSPEAAKVGVAARALVSDLTSLARARLTCGAWGERLATLAERWLIPSNGEAGGLDERDELERLVLALRSLEEHELGEDPISYRLAHDLALELLPQAARGRGTLGSGVRVGTLEAIGSLPCRVLFIAGLDEQSLAGERTGPLDLTLAAPQPGDISPREHQQYAFLEAMLAARERLYLSYVARDAATGELLPPSPLTTRLHDFLRRAYLPAGLPKDAAESAWVRRPPLRRYHASLFPSLTAAAGRDFPSSDAARREARAALGLPAPAGASAAGALLTVSTPSSGASHSPRRVPLRRLYDFLLCPITGAARLQLELREEEEERALMDEEPLESTFVAGHARLREALFGAFEGGGVNLLERANARHTQLFERARLAGEAPSGPFGAGERASELHLLGRWSEALAQLTREEGSARAIKGLDLAAPRGTAGAGILLSTPHGEVELVGLTEPLLSNLGSSLATSDKRLTNDQGSLAKIQQRALRAFLDHAALGALGLHPGGAHRLLLCCADGQLRTATLAPLTEDEARAWLAELAGALIGPIEGLYAPFKAFAAAFGRPECSLTAALAKCAEEAQSQMGRARGKPREGAIRAPHTFPLPSEERARALLERRYLPFFSRYHTEKLARRSS